jgi:hypothetical protein
MQSLVTDLHNKAVVMNADNKNASSILKIGSKQPYLHDIALKVNDLCSDNNISLFS